MIKNYFITAVRNLLRNRSYTILNVVGLTLGIACFSLIMLHVENEMSYDQFHTEKAYRFLISEQTGDNSSRTFGVNSIATHELIADNVAGVEDVLIVRDYVMGTLLVEHGEKKFKSREFFFTEPEFFDFFGFELLIGDPKTVMSDPNNIVITESTAERIFGDQDPIGEFIKFSGSSGFTCQVAGVMEDTKNSHIKFDFLLSADLRDEVNDYIMIREGFNNSVYGYYKLAEGSNPEEVADRVKQYFIEYLEINRPEAADYIREKETYAFQPIDEIYFDSNHVVYDSGFVKGDKANIITLAVIGLFTLLIACMNYINASTAKAINRSKEIGVRKVFGAFRLQLITQFLGEAFLLSFISVLLSVLVTDLALPFFEQMMATKLRYSLTTNPVYIQGLLGVLVFVTILSGSYPALVLSKFKPSDSIKNQKQGGFLKGGKLRSFLVGVQLFLTMGLISGVLLILDQTKYIDDKDLGYSTDDIVIIPNSSPDIDKQVDSYKNELLRSPYIKMVTSGVDVMGFENTNNSGKVILEGNDPAEAPLSTFFSVGQDFLDVQGLEIVQGRTFDANLRSDTLAIIVNEAFVRAVGEENIVGKKARLWSADGIPQPIVGVVKDFNFKSLRSEVAPAIFMVNERRNWFFTLKIDVDHTKEALDHARTAWEAIDPNLPMGHMFLNDNLAEYYDSEARLQSAIQWFAILCIVISCLGLYGMTTFTIERRIKEIGIRKVLGAQIRQLVWMINQKFILVFLLGGAAAIPLVYYLISQWLEGFAYHINIGPLPFLLAALIVALIVAITVSAQSIKAAVLNPAKTLRSE